MTHKQSLTERDWLNCDLSVIDNLPPHLTDMSIGLTLPDESTYLFLSSEKNITELLRSNIGGYGGTGRGGTFPKFFCHILQDAASEGHLKEGMFTLRFRDQNAWFWQDDIQQYECTVGGNENP